MNTAVSLPDKNSDEATKIAMGYRWYGFETYAEGGSLDAVLLNKDEYAVVKRIFDEGETIYDEGYSGSVSLFGSEDGYESKLDLMRAYAKETSFLHPEDIIDKDMAAIIEKEQDEGLFEEEDEIIFDEDEDEDDEEDEIIFDEDEEGYEDD